MIVVGAIVVALLILAAALGYRHYEDAAARDAAREEAIDSRLRELGSH